MTLEDFLKKEGTNLISFVNKLKEYSYEGIVLINGNSNFLIKEKIIDGKIFIDLMPVEGEK